MSLTSVGAKAQETLTVTSLDNDGDGSLRDILSQAADGDFIEFDTLGTIQLQTQLELNNGVTINGAGVTLDGVDNSTRLLRINAPGNTVVINNLTFINGGARGGDGGDSGFTGGGGGAGLGGAILADSGDLVLVQTVFQNNVVVGGDGGTGNDAFVGADPTNRAAGAGGGGLGDVNDGPDVFNDADGGDFESTTAGQPGGFGGTSDFFVVNPGGNAGQDIDEDGEAGTDGTDNDGGGGGGGLAFDGSGGAGGAGGLGGGGGGGGDGDVGEAAEVAEGEGPPAPTRDADGLGGNGGFGGGGGGGQSNFVLNPDAEAETRGGLAGAGGGDGELNADDAASAAAGGGGAGLGAAIFINEGASLTLSDVNFSEQTGNVATAGVGGSDNAGDGQTAGAFVFVRGDGAFLGLDVNSDQTIDFSPNAGGSFISDTSDLTLSAAAAPQTVGILKSGAGQLRFVGDDDPDTVDLDLGQQHLLFEGSINLDSSFNSTDSISVFSSLFFFDPVFFDDATFVEDTTLFGNGSIGSINNVSGRVSPGDGVGQIGTLTVTDQFSQSAGANLDIEVSEDDIDLVRVVDASGDGVGLATLGGNVNLIQIDPTLPLDTPLVFLEAETITGEFDNVNTLFFDGNVLTTGVVSAGTRTDADLGLTLETREATFTEVDPLTVLGSVTGRENSSQVALFVGGLLNSADPAEADLGATLLDGLIERTAACGGRGVQSGVHRGIGVANRCGAERQRGGGGERGGAGQHRGAFAGVGRGAGAKRNPGPAAAEHPQLRRPVCEPAVGPAGQRERPVHEPAGGPRGR